jgi:hypothetical protein
VSSIGISGELASGGRGEATGGGLAGLSDGAAIDGALVSGGRSSSGDKPRSSKSIAGGGSIGFVAGGSELTPDGALGLAAPPPELGALAVFVAPADGEPDGAGFGGAAPAAAASIASVGFGTTTPCPQLGHLAFFPAAATSATNTFPQLHLNFNFMASPATTALLPKEVTPARAYYYA